MLFSFQRVEPHLAGGQRWPKVAASTPKQARTCPHSICPARPTLLLAQRPNHPCNSPSPTPPPSFHSSHKRTCARAHALCWASPPPLLPPSHSMHARHTHRCLLLVEIGAHYRGAAHLQVAKAAAVVRHHLRAHAMWAGALGSRVLCTPRMLISPC